MSLINALPVIFEDNLFVAEALSSEALASHEETLKKRIAEKEKTGAALAELRGLRALLPLFDYLKSHPEKTQSLYVWLLDWQLSTFNKTLTPQQKHVLSMDLLNIMKRFLNHHESNAIHYYRSNEGELGEASSAVTRLMKDMVNKEEPMVVHTKTLEEWTNYFNAQLKGQANLPAIILQLAVHYYETPHAFAALLFWLFENGVSPETIIFSRLLHRFFEGHVAYLVDADADHHPMRVLYQVLRDSSHPAAVELVDRAEKMSAYIADNTKEKKFKKEMLRGFERYDLTGRLHAKESMAAGSVLTELLVLSREQLHHPAIRINASPENIHALSTVFSGSFLRLLATVRSVAKQLTEAQWHDYAALSMGSIEDGITGFSALFDLHDLLKRYCFSASVQVFARIFDLALLHRQEVAEDAAFIKKMRGLMCPPIRSVVFERVNRIITEFRLRMPAQAADLTLACYRVIENEWLKITEMLEFIKSIYKTLDFSFFEENVYQLQANLLVRYRGYVLDTLLEACSDENFLLTEWLAREPDSLQQDWIIDRLCQKHKITKQIWNYNGCACDSFVMACKAGNEVLVTRFLRGEMGALLPGSVLVNGFIGAAGHARGAVLELMFSSNPGIVLSQNNINQAFSRIPLDDVMQILSIISQRSGRVLSSELINKSFVSAIRDGMLDLVIFLLEYERQNHLLVEANFPILLDLAVVYGQLPIVKYLCESPYASNQDGVNNAFISSIENNHLDIASYLSQSPRGVKLNKNQMQSIFTLAVRTPNEEMLDFLLTCFKDHLREDESLFVLLYTSTLRLRQPQRLVLLFRSEITKWHALRYLETLLGILMNNGEVEVVAALCGIVGEHPFEDHIFLSALRVAALKGKLDFFMSVCQLGGDDSILKMLKISRDIHCGYYLFEDKRALLDAVHSLFNWPGERPLKQETVFKALGMACDQGLSAFITAVCGLEAGRVLDEARVRFVLNYAKARNLNEILRLIFLKVMNRFEEGGQLLLDCLNLVLGEKTMPEKYQSIAGYYGCAPVSEWPLERAIALFNFMDRNSAAFGVDMQPRKSPWSPTFMGRKKPSNDGEAWAAAWGEIRLTIFNQWLTELTDPLTIPGRKQALMALFEGCGEPDGPHHKLMGMGRTSGKPHSKTSKLIKAEIAKAKQGVAPRPH